MAEKPKDVICRVCLRSDRKISEKCLSLFEKYKTGLISDIINSIANVEIRQGDGLPDKICPDCLLELDTAVNFKSKCESSNGLLKSTVLNEGNIVKSDLLVLEFNIDNIKKEEPSESQRDYFDDTLNEEVFVEARFNVKRGSRVKKERVTNYKSKDLKLECAECGEFFKSKCKLRVHWKRVHMQHDWVCEKCKRTFKTEYAYNKHLNDKNAPCQQMTKVNIEGVGKDRKFYCQQCDYKSHRLKDMKRHLNSHTGVHPYECTICHKSYTQRSTLNSHVETAHKMYKTEVTCQYCGKYLRGRTRVYSHLRQHRLQGVQCDICNKVLRSKKNLIVHLRRHTGDKMNTCELCGASYCTIWELGNHQRTVHERGKHIHKCDICEYETFNSVTMNRHKKKHTLTNVCCLVCGVFVASNEALVLHQKRHYKKYQCPYCSLKYARKDSLQKHIRAKHEFTFSSAVSKPVVVKTEAPVN